MSDDVRLAEVSVPEVDRPLLACQKDGLFSAAVCLASVGERLFHRKANGALTGQPRAPRCGLDTVFDLASLTKPLGSGLLALYLVGRGKLDLGAPLRRFLPQFDASPFAEVSVDMLLDHTAGFPATCEYGGPLRALGVAPKDYGAHAQRITATLAPVHAPGSAVLYSDVGFLVLGWLLEALLGEPMDVALRRDIYAPLGLADDLFFVAEARGDAARRVALARRRFAATEQCPLRGRLLQGEVHDPTAALLGGVCGHAGLFGTGDAVWRLARELWRAYVGEESLFHGATVRRFWARSKRPRETTRTLAWDTPSARDSAAGQRFSRVSVGHLGFTGTSLWIDVNTGVIGVLLTNAAHPSPEGKRERLRELRARVYDAIAKHGEALPTAPGEAGPRGALRGAGGVGLPLASPIRYDNPLRGPRK